MHSGVPQLFRPAICYSVTCFLSLWGKIQRQRELSSCMSRISWGFFFSVAEDKVSSYSESMRYFILADGFKRGKFWNWQLNLKFSGWYPLIWTFKTSRMHPGSLIYYCQILFPLCSKWEKAHASFKFILLTSLPTTDKSCDFQADIIQFDHLKQGERILTAWNTTARYCSPSVQNERRLTHLSNSLTIH